MPSNGIVESIERKDAPPRRDARFPGMNDTDSSLLLARRGLLLGGAALVLGCSTPGRAKRDRPRSATPMAPPATAPSGIASPQATVSASPACHATAPNIEGPFYKPGAPERARIVSGGGMLVVEGRVLDHRCQPLAHALVDVWQADPSGAYDNHGFGLRGRLRSDAEGRYRLETVRPGHYLNGDRYRPAHIHVKLSASGMRPLTTQLYFPGDPHNAGDPFIDRSLIMRLHDEALAEFDFVMAAV
jgi:catechol 1,2-dioxygenase